MFYNSERNRVDILTVRLLSLDWNLGVCRFVLLLMNLYFLSAIVIYSQKSHRTVAIQTYLSTTVIINSALIIIVEKLWLIKQYW